MKNCPKCKCELDDNAKFCLRCMTSLEPKQKFKPPESKKRRWLFAVLACLALCAVLFVLRMCVKQPSDLPEATEADGTNTTVTTAVLSNTATNPVNPTTTTGATTTEETTTEEETTATTTNTTTTTTKRNPKATVVNYVNGEKHISFVKDGLTFTVRPTTKEEYPEASNTALAHFYTLIHVEGTPDDGIHHVPAYVGNNPELMIAVIAEGAFKDADALAVDLPFTVGYVQDGAFNGSAVELFFVHARLNYTKKAFDQELSKCIYIFSPSDLKTEDGFNFGGYAVEELHLNASVPFWHVSVHPPYFYISKTSGGNVL